MIRTIQILLLVLLPIQIYGQEVKSEIMKIQALIAQGEYKEVLSSGVSGGSQSEQVLLSMAMGKSSCSLGDYNTAIQFFQQAEVSKPGIAALDLARSYMNLGDKNRMFESLADHMNSPYKLPRKDIMLDPVFKDLDRDRDWIRFWSGNWYNEEDDLLAESKYLIDQNDLDEAFWTNLILNHDNHAGIMSQIAKYYEITGHRQKADQAFEKSVKLDPDNLGLNLQYADYLIDQGSFKKAQELLDAAIALDPYEIKLYTKRVLAIFKSGRTQDGVAELERLEQYGIDASGLNYMLAKELLEDDPAASVSYLDPVIAENPTAQSFNLRAKAYQNLGNDFLAIQDLGMSLDINPKQADVYFDRARLRHEEGDHEGACHDWQYALKLGHRKAQDMLYKYCR